MPFQQHFTKPKTPSQMDEAPWDDHWMKMVLDGIEWYLMVFDGTRWYRMVLNVTLWISMILDDIGCYRMVFNGIA